MWSYTDSEGPDNESIISIKFYIKEPVKFTMLCLILEASASIFQFLLINFLTLVKTRLNWKVKYIRHRSSFENPAYSPIYLTL